DQDGSGWRLGAGQDLERRSVEMMPIADERGTQAVVRGLAPDRVWVPWQACSDAVSEVRGKRGSRVDRLGNRQGIRGGMPDRHGDSGRDNSSDERNRP